MTTLYELNEQLRELEHLDDIDEQTFLDTWCSLSQERSEKIEAILNFIKHLRFMAEGIKIEAKKLSDRAKSYENRADGLLEYLRNQLKEGEAYESARHQIVWRKSQSVEVTVEPEELPEIYQRRKFSIEANKRALLDDLKCGAEVEGVRIVEKLNMGVK